MSLDVRAASNALSFDDIDIDDFLKESERAGVSASPKRNRRLRRKNIKRNVSKASLVAPLLAAEGCLTLGKEDVALNGGELSEREQAAGGGVSANTTPAGNSAPSTFAASGDEFQISANEPLSVPAAQLLANDIHGSNGSLELVRVFGAENGTVLFDGGIVTFVPDDDFQGVAQFSYEVRDESGRSRVGDVIVDVDGGVVTLAETHEHEFNRNEDTQPSNFPGVGGGGGDVVDGGHDGDAVGDGHGDHDGDSDADVGADTGADDGNAGENGHGDHSGDAGEDGHGDHGGDSGDVSGDAGGDGHGDHGGDSGDGEPSNFPGEGDSGDSHGDHGGDSGDAGGDGHGDHGGDSGDAGEDSHGDHGGDSGDSGEDGHGDHGGDSGDAGGDDHGHHAHPDDPSKAGEHAALLNLVPVSEATHVAVNSGSWFDPSIWASGDVPGEGAKVHIPHGLSVDYDGESAASLFTVRVDGMLNFATDQDTFMEVDTLIVAPSGHMTVGTLSNPVAAGVEAVIQIADNGPIDVAWDPMLLSRGVISHGSIDIHGAEKDTFLKLATDPMAGDTSLTLEEAPEGWNVGDRLVLTGTHYTNPPGGAEGTPQDLTTEDEELVITAINGNVIHFETPLQYDHDTPRDDLKAYVANYSRNVRILTEDADDAPAHERGHVMFMHSDEIDVRYAEFFELGRTDKSERAFDAGELSDVASDSNVKGRYAVHIHRAGVSDVDDPAMVVGNAVWGSPGWGFVHHDSNAVLADNAAYDVSGAAFVAETGNEIGRWSHNIAIKSIGVKGVGAQNTPKINDDVATFDLGRTGVGFWFQGRLVDAVDNVAAGMPGGQGFAYFHRGTGQIDVEAAVAPHSESFRYTESVDVTIPNISMFHNNETIASAGGFLVIKATPLQGHDIRSVISDFTAWEVSYGAHLEYTSHYTFNNVDFVAAEGHNRTGFYLGTNVIDLVVNNADISGFTAGVEASRLLTFGADQNYTFIETNIEGATTPYINAGAELGDLILSQSDLSDGPLTFQSNYEDIPTVVIEGWRSSIELSGTKTDSVGDVEVSKEWDRAEYNWYAFNQAAVEEGFWTLPDGGVVVALEQYISDRATGFLHKTSTFVEIQHDAVDLVAWFEGRGAENRGLLDLSNAAPVTTADHATVSENGSVVVDVLANDSDPDGDDLTIDGFIHPTYGDVHVNNDGTITYTPDPNYVGADHLSYWVDDGQGNLTMGELHITVEI